MCVALIERSARLPEIPYVLCFVHVESFVVFSYFCWGRVRRVEFAHNDKDRWMRSFREEASSGKKSSCFVVNARF